MRGSGVHCRATHVGGGCSAGPEWLQPACNVRVGRPHAAVHQRPCLCRPPSGSSCLSISPPSALARRQTRQACRCTGRGLGVGAEWGARMQRSRHPLSQTPQRPRVAGALWRRERGWAVVAGQAPNVCPCLEPHQCLERLEPGRPGNAVFPQKDLLTPFRHQSWDLVCMSPPTRSLLAGIRPQ